MTDADVATFHAFLHFYHLDCANASIHLADVRFSPITVKLVGALRLPADEYPDQVRAAVNHVRSHDGQYELDPGR